MHKEIQEITIGGLSESSLIPGSAGGQYRLTSLGNETGGVGTTECLNWDATTNQVQHAIDSVVGANVTTAVTLSSANDESRVYRVEYMRPVGALNLLNVAMETSVDKTLCSWDGTTTLLNDGYMTWTLKLNANLNDLSGGTTAALDTVVTQDNGCVNVANVLPVARCMLLVACILVFLYSFFQSYISYYVCGFRFFVSNAVLTL